MTAPKWVDSKLIIWGLTMVGVGVMAYARLDALGASVERVQTTLDEAQSGLAEHVASDGHTTRGIKVAELEDDQGKLETRIERIDTRQQRMERNQVRMCQAWNVTGCE